MPPSYDADEDEHTGYDGTTGHPEDEEEDSIPQDDQNVQRFSKIWDRMK